MKQIDLEKLWKITGGQAMDLENELHQLTGLLAANFELKVFLENQAVPAAAKQQLIAELMPQASKLLKDVLALLIDQDLTKGIARLAADFTKLAAGKTGTVFAEVESAEPLSVEQTKRISALISGQVKIREKLNPNLLGGVKFLTSDGRFFDATLAGGLARLKQGMANAR